MGYHDKPQLVGVQQIWNLTVWKYMVKLTHDHYNKDSMFNIGWFFRGTGDCISVQQNAGKVAV